MRKCIVLAVTVDQSLTHFKGFPELLVERGWDVHLVSSPGQKLSRFAEVEGVTVHALSMRRSPHPFSDLIAFGKWVALFARLRPAVLSVGTPKASLLGLLAARVAFVPQRQYLVRGLRLETARGLLLKILRASERICLSASTDAVAVGFSLKDRIVELGLAKSSQIHVVGQGSSNGIDLSRFDPERFSETEKTSLAAINRIDRSVPVVGYVGRIAQDKGIVELVDGLIELGSAGVDAQLLVVGAFDDPESADEIARARAAGVTVTVAPHTEDPAPLMSLMDVFCIPSKREGFSNVAIEAAAMRLPVVATNVTGLTDAVLDGETGLLSTTGEAIDLAALLGKLLNNPNLRLRYGEAGRRRVEASFERGQVQLMYADRLERLASLATAPSNRRKTERS